MISIGTALPLPFHVLLGLPGGLIPFLFIEELQDYSKLLPHVWLVETKSGIYAPISVTTLYSSFRFSKLLSSENNVLLQYIHIFCPLCEEFKVLNH